MELKRKKSNLNVNAEWINHHEFIRENYSWKTSKSKAVKLTDMDENHIKNAINKINRGDYQGYQGDRLLILKSELKYRSVQKKRKLNLIKEKNGRKRTLG